MSRLLALVLGLALALAASACGRSEGNLLLHRSMGRDIPSSIAFWTEQTGVVGGRTLSGDGSLATCGAGCGEGFVAVTSDGGDTWHVSLRTNVPITDVAVVPSTGNAYASTTSCSQGTCRGSLYQTTDRGRTWRPLPASPVLDPMFGSPQVGWGFPAGTASSRPTAIEATVDRGRTWRPAPAPCRAPTDVVSAVALGTVRFGRILCTGPESFGVQEKALYETTTGGKTWSRIGSARSVADTVTAPGSSSSPCGASGMFLLPDGRTWLWGQPGSLFRSDRTGTRWRRSATIDRQGVEARSVWFVSGGTGRTGFLVAFVWPLAYAALLRTTDDGATWSPIHDWLLPDSFSHQARHGWRKDSGCESHSST